jgi:HSP20 family protein
MALLKKNRAKKKVATSTSGAKAPAKAEEERAPARSRGLTAFDDLDRLFEDFMRRRWPSPMHMQWPLLRGAQELFEDRVPSVDIVDNDNEIIVRAELPGVDRKNLDVSVVDRTLTIRGTQREEKEEKKKDFYRKEIRSGEFSRSVLLPADVDADKAKASYKDGVVELHLPKATESRRRKIPLG